MTTKKSVEPFDTSNKISSNEASLISIIFLFMMIILLWSATNPSLFAMSFFYLILLSVSFASTVFYYFFPNNPFFDVLPMGNSERILRGFLLGIIIAVVVVIFNGILVGRSGFMESSIVDTETVGLILLIIAVPFCEELFIGSLLGATFRKKAGFAFSVVASMLIFSIMHWVIFNADASLLFVSMAFRGIATSVSLYEKSWTSGYFAHVIYNILQAIPFAVWLSIGV